jgi:hypothetical protein
MDFLERIFRFSPDGGGGSSELLIMVLVALAVLTLISENPSLATRQENG